MELPKMYIGNIKSIVGTYRYDKCLFTRKQCLTSSKINYDDLNINKFYAIVTIEQDELEINITNLHTGEFKDENIYTGDYTIRNLYLTDINDEIKKYNENHDEEIVNRYLVEYEPILDEVYEDIKKMINTIQYINLKLEKIKNKQTRINLF